MNKDALLGFQQGRVVELGFPDDHVVPALCRVALLQAPSGAIEIAVLELNANHGRSVTNSWPILADRVLAECAPGVRVEDVLWYEVYPSRWRGEEEVCRVKIANGRHQFEYEPEPAVRRRIWVALGLDLEEATRRFPDFGRSQR
jgi:hypothetical protein